MMAQLWLTNSTDEVITILNDGVHPGFDVVDDPLVWNSRPTLLRRVFVPGPASDFTELGEQGLDSGPPDFSPKPGVKRRLVLEFTVSERANLARDRSIARSKANNNSKKNPNDFP